MLKILQLIKDTDLIIVSKYSDKQKAFAVYVDDPINDKHVSICLIPEKLTEEELYARIEQAVHRLKGD